jgi:hypothetical protein
MTNLLNIYKKYKKGCGKNRLNPPIVPTVAGSGFGMTATDITDSDIERIENLVNKLNLNVKLNSFENECNQYIMKLGDATKIEDLTCYTKYLQMYQDPKANITEKLKQLYESQNTDYKKIKCYLDGYDIIHDVRSVSGYIDKLKDIYRQYDNTNHFLVITNNHQLSKVREEKIKSLKNKLPVPVETQDDKDLTEDSGYSTFFKEIYKIGSMTDRFTYRESGRYLSYSELIKYEKSLTGSKKTNFRQSCTGGDSNMEVKYTEIFGPPPPTTSYDLEIPKDSISSFDACGQEMTNKREPDEVQIFKDIYSFYDYYVYSQIHEINTCHIPIHIVAVTLNNISQLKAFFLIQGEPSINFLVEKSNEIFNSESKYTTVPIPRKKKKKEEEEEEGEEEGEEEEEEEEELSGGKPTKSDIPKKITITSTPNLIKNSQLNCKKYNNDINSIIDDGINKLVLSISTSSSLSSSSSSSLRLDISTLKRDGYYFVDTNWQENQLLLFGIKTVGDLMFTCKNYKNKIKLLSTTDSFIKASVLYNYLSGNSPILQSVWRKDKNKGWIYSKGILKNSPEEQTKQLLIKFSSILGFIKSLESIKSFEPTRSIININDNNMDRLKLLRNSILINIFEPTSVDTLKPKYKTLNFDLSFIFLKYINQLHNTDLKNQMKTIMDTQLNFNNMFNLLSYLILYHEILHKYELINKYIDKLCSIDITDFVEPIEKINPLPNLIYLNTISFYENNISSINTTTLEIQKQSSKRSTRQNTQTNVVIPSSFIFNIDPKLEKVIIKEKVTINYTEGKRYKDGTTIHEEKIKMNTININVLKKDDLNDIKRLIFENNFNNNEHTTKYSDNTYIKDRKRTIKLMDDMDYMNNYIIDKSGFFDNDIYYKLINDTLNYEKLEILTFSYFNFNLKSTKKPDILELGEYKDETNNIKIFVNLWKVPNKIGNLFKLLEFKSIQDDFLSSGLILTRILTHFKNSLIDYEDIIDIRSDIIISNYIKRVDVESIKIIVNNLIELKKDETKTYMKMLEIINKLKVITSSMDVVSYRLTPDEKSFLEKLYNMDKDIYDALDAAQKEDVDNESRNKQIDEKIIEKINEKISECESFIVRLDGVKSEVESDVSESQTSDGEIEVVTGGKHKFNSKNKIGGNGKIYESIQGDIINAYLSENYWNKLIFDGPDDDYEYYTNDDSDDNFKLSETMTTISEVEEEFLIAPNQETLINSNVQKLDEMIKEIPHQKKREREDSSDEYDSSDEFTSEDESYYGSPKKSHHGPQKKRKNEQDEDSEYEYDTDNYSQYEHNTDNYSQHQLYPGLGGKKTKRQNASIKRKNKKTRRKIK